MGKVVKIHKVKKNVEGDWKTEHFCGWGGVLKDNIWWECSLRGAKKPHLARTTINRLADGQPLTSDEILWIDTISKIAENFCQLYGCPLPPRPKALTDLINRLIWENRTKEIFGE